MNLEEASDEILEFFIGKIGCGLITYFQMKDSWAKLESKNNKNNHLWSDRFLSIQSQDRKLLFKAWSFFTPNEKSLCLDFLSVGVLNCPNLICLTYGAKDYYLARPTFQSNETVFSFFQKLLTDDAFLDLIYNNDLVKKEILCQFQRFSKKKNDQKASVYLFLFFNLVRTENNK
jgi:hypothetical protein